LFAIHCPLCPKSNRRQGGADRGLFSIDGTGHLTMTVKDFENPADADRRKGDEVRPRSRSN
jgi:hypothetical protein